ncbi:MAG TPA: SLC13 family permease [Lachnospiraceae bacterium]|nr:SLC13 family permease [Lachnospiraceae bacterium]
MNLKRLKNFIKKETVLVIASVLAILSAFAVPPSEKYIKYIDLRVLALLLCLMLVVAGFQSIGLFENLIMRLLRFTKTTRILYLVLVFLCFFTSMLITNDVALITFVPFAILTLQKVHKDHYLILIIVLQTIAANLGSMLTPLGNPQNLYLYSVSGMSLGSFLRTMGPATGFSLLLILTTLLFLRNDVIQPEDIEPQRNQLGKGIQDHKALLLYSVLFLLCLGTVLHIIFYGVTLAIVICCILLYNRQLLWKADYSLLLTFVAFFIFIGNLGNLSSISHLLEDTVSNRELYVGVGLSQVVSNVPAAILLSGFTDNYRQLLLGVNLGGLGTLIASMASLISFRFYSNCDGARKGRYLLIFTGLNLLYLALLLVFVKLI